VIRKLAASNALLTLALVMACRAPMRAGVRPEGAWDVIVTNARIVDGTGNAWFWGEVAVRGDRIARVAPRGLLAGAVAARRIDARGMVLAPGFIDIQAQSYGNFLNGDGRALSMVTQGITTAILGEGTTPAPVNDNTLASVTDTTERRAALRFSGEHGFGTWLDSMARRGLSQNVGSFLGSGTARVYAVGRRTGPPTPAELDTMRAMVRRAMLDGAFGVASALIYPPNNYSSTEELIEQARASAPLGGVYVTHMRSEGDDLLEAVDEALRIGREGGVAVEIYHLKASGPANWPKMARAIAKIDSARAAGQDVQANMYLYIAGANNFSSCIAPAYAADGKLLDNLRDPATRGRVKADLERRIPGFDNLCLAAGPENVMVTGFRKAEYRDFEGKRLSQIASALGRHWTDALIDLNIAEEARLGEILFLMSEENVRMQLRQPWIKFGTDAGSQDPATARGMTHPRAYGNFPRLFGKYVREDRVLELEDAVRKATSAVATRLSIPDRGLVKEGMKADLVIFDPATIADRATFEQPHQLSVGVRHVFVNGVEVLRDGEHTGAKPGQVVRGPGWGGWRTP
jgi:dihydroorotase/N-acyl-D-amino-acid deacylase